MPALAMFVTFLEALLLAVCHVMSAMHYVDGLVKQVLEYAMLGVLLGFHLMYLLRETRVALLHQQPLSHFGHGCKACCGVQAIMKVIWRLWSAFMRW